MVEALTLPVISFQAVNVFRVVHLDSTAAILHRNHSFFFWSFHINFRTEELSGDIVAPHFRHQTLKLWDKLVVLVCTLQLLCWIIIYIFRIHHHSSFWAKVLFASSLCCQDSTVPFSSVSNWKLPFERLKRSSLTRRRMSEFACVIWNSRLPTPMDSSCFSEISWKKTSLSHAKSENSQFSKLWKKLISLHSPSWSFDSERNKVMVSSGDHSTVPPASTKVQSVQHQNLTEWLSSWAPLVTAQSL